MTSTMTWHKRDRNRKCLCAFFFSFACLNCTTEYFFTVCILYISVYQWNTTYMMYIEKLQRMCSIKYCFTNAKMKMNHRLRATGSSNFFLSSSKLPKSLFSCVIFSKVPIFRSKCTYIWLIYVILTYQCVLSDKRDMLMMPAVTSP